MGRVNGHDARAEPGEPYDFEALQKKLLAVEEPMSLLIHRECGQPAFWLATRAMQTGTIMRASDARDLEGQVPPEHTIIKCYSCGKSVAPTFDFLRVHGIEAAGEPTADPPLVGTKALKEDAEH